MDRRRFDPTHRKHGDTGLAAKPVIDIMAGVESLEYLRAHPDTAAEYAALKRRLADAHRFDRDAYTTAKTPFVQRVVARAIGRE